MNKKIVLGITTVLILTLIAVGLFRKFSKNQTKEVIKIGAILPLTGVGSVPGEYLKNGMDLAFKTLLTENIKIEVIFDDSKSTPNQGISAYMKQKNVDKVDINVFALSSVTMSLIPVLDSTIPAITTLTTYPDITKKSNSLFRIFINSSDEARAMANYVAKDLGIKKIAIIYNNDEGGIGSRNAFYSEYSKLEGTLVAEETYSAQETEFRNLITKIRTNKSYAGVFVVGFGNSLGLIIKQIREARIDVPIFTLSQFGSNDSRLAAGAAGKDIIYTAPAYNYAKSSSKQEFDSLYYHQYKVKPNFISAYGYETAKFIIESVKNLKENQNLTESLMETTIDGISGSKLKFSNSREVNSLIRIVKWDGSSELLLN